MGCPAVGWFLTAVRLADCRDMRKVKAGVVQGEALFAGVAILAFLIAWPCWARFSELLTGLKD
jgi:hypothetical protein